MRATLKLQSCDFRAEAADVYFSRIARGLRLSSWSRGSVLCVTRLDLNAAILGLKYHLHYQVASFELELRTNASRTTLLLNTVSELELRSTAETCFANCTRNMKF